MLPIYVSRECNLRKRVRERVAGVGDSVGRGAGPDVSN